MTDSRPSVPDHTRRTAISAVLMIAAVVILPWFAFVLAWYSPQATSRGYWDADFGRHIPDTRVWWWSAAACWALTLGSLVLCFSRRRAAGRWWIWPVSTVAFIITAFVTLQRVGAGV